MGHGAELLLILSIGAPTTCRTKIKLQPSAFFYIYQSIGLTDMFSICLKTAKLRHAIYLLLRYYGPMSAQEIAYALNNSEYTIWEYHKTTGSLVTEKDIRACINNKNQYLIIKVGNDWYNI